jgi:hypothetical protein
MTASQTINLSARKGDTWNGFSMSITKNGTPVDLTDAELLMQLKKKPSDTDAQLEFSSLSAADYTITTNSVSSFSVDPTIIDINANDYFYDFQITFADGVVLTPFEGTFTIFQDVSR